MGSVDDGCRECQGPPAPPCCNRHCAHEVGQLDHRALAPHAWQHLQRRGTLPAEIWGASSRPTQRAWRESRARRSRPRSPALTAPTPLPCMPARWTCGAPRTSSTLATASASPFPPPTFHGGSRLPSSCGSLPRWHLGPQTSVPRCPLYSFSNNPNTGDPLGKNTTMHVADNTIFYGGWHASR